MHADLTMNTITPTMNKQEYSCICLQNATAAKYRSAPDSWCLRAHSAARAACARSAA